MTQHPVVAPQSTREDSVAPPTTTAELSWESHSRVETAEVESTTKPEATIADDLANLSLYPPPPGPLPPTLSQPAGDAPQEQYQQQEQQPARLQEERGEVGDERVAEPPREDEWRLKSIPWPILPAPPAFSESHGSQFLTGSPEEGLSVKIICQNANGPCSLIALCNVLILRGDIAITPPGRNSVNYSYLSSLVGDYLLRTSTTTSEALSSALSILPSTQYGLNLNPRFGSIDGFRSSSTTSTSTTDEGEEAGELALYRLARVPLVHGWVVDPQDGDLWDIVAEKAGDYDTALEKVVEGDVLSDDAGDLENATEEQILQAVERRSQWTPEEERKVREAHEIRRFLNSTQTQLTYHGLFLLSSHLTPSSLSALFRNSHLSVIFRRPSIPASGAQNLASTGPELFTLVTDSTFAHEPGVVWESLEDVDGSASSFYDGNLRKSDIRGGDWVGTRRASRRREPPPVVEPLNVDQWQEPPRIETVLQGGGAQSHDPDLALAQQLQSEEDEYERRQVYLARRQQQEREERRRRAEEQEQQRQQSEVVSSRNEGRGRERERERERSKLPPSRKEQKVEKEKDSKCLVM